MKRSPAYTLIEVIIVLAILGMAAIPAFFVYNRSQANQRLAASAEIFSNHLRQAHTFSRDSRESKTWGIVWQSSNSYTLVSYTTDIAILTNEQSYQLQSGIEFTMPFANIWFDKLTGNSSLPVTVQISNKYGRQHTVQVYTTGVIEVIPI